MFGLALAFLGLTGCSKRATEATLPAAACPPFDALALDRLPTNFEATAGDDFDQAWRDWSTTNQAPPTATPGMADAEFRFQSNPGMGGRNSREAVGRREGGQWRIVWRTRPNAGGPLTPWSAWRSTTLADRFGRQIDRLLADPCLWSTPRYLANSLPLKTGRWAPSYDGPITFFDVRSGNRQWGGIQVSWRLGVPARLRAVIGEAVFGEPSFVDSGLPTAGLLDQPE